MEYLGLPQWADYLLKGILLFVALASAAVVLTRAGRSPWFSFLLIVPFVQMAALWYFSYLLWPGIKKKT